MTTPENTLRVGIPSPGPSFRGALASRDFTLLFIGQLTAAMGNGAVQLALPWLVLKLTDSALAARSRLLLPVPADAAVRRARRRLCRPLGPAHDHVRHGHGARRRLHLRRRDLLPRRAGGGAPVRRDLPRIDDGELLQPGARGADAQPGQGRGPARRQLADGGLAPRRHADLPVGWRPARGVCRPGGRALRRRRHLPALGDNRVPHSLAPRQGPRASSRRRIAGARRAHRRAADGRRAQVDRPRASAAGLDAAGAQPQRRRGADSAIAAPVRQRGEARRGRLLRPAGGLPARRTDHRLARPRRVWRGASASVA